MKTRKFPLIGIVAGWLLLGLIAFLAGIQFHVAHQAELNTALIRALHLGAVEAVPSLLAQGADPNARDLPAAPSRGVMQQFEEMITHPLRPERDKARTALSCACDTEHAPALVKLLLENGASVRADDASLQPALPWCARSRGGDMVTCRLLLDHGADVNVRDKDGYTALAGASLTNNPKLVRLLLDRGAQVKPGSTQFANPASMTHSAEIRQMLEDAANKR